MNLQFYHYLKNKTTSTIKNPKPTMEQSTLGILMYTIVVLLKTK